MEFGKITQHNVLDLPMVTPYNHRILYAFTVLSYRVDMIILLFRKFCLQQNCRGVGRHPIPLPRTIPEEAFV
jgi:hypothetical protein